MLSNTPGTVEAADNWWGSASGPTHPSNPNGTGDLIKDGANGGAGTVNFTPFLPTTAETSAHCRSLPAPALDGWGLAVCGLGLLLFGCAVLTRRQLF